MPGATTGTATWLLTNAPLATGTELGLNIRNLLPEAVHRGEMAHDPRTADQLVAPDAVLGPARRIWVPARTAGAPLAHQHHARRSRTTVASPGSNSQCLSLPIREVAGHIGAHLAVPGLAKLLASPTRP